MQKVLIPFIPLIEKRLDKLLSFPNLPEDKLYQASRYAIFSGGKRLRPLITLSTVQSFQKDPEIALTLACALELIHTYSLIHDDLPCMDDDDFRRGKPTVHKAFDEATAVLAGDFLLTYAFDVITSDPYLNPQVKLQCIELLAKKAGGRGLIGGQILDLQNTELNFSLEMVAEVHNLKTASLIECAFEFGAIASLVSVEMQKTVAIIGKTLGLAYQIIDDVIDITASERKHGIVQTLSTDVINGKTTFATYLGIEKAKAYAEKLLLEAQNNIKTLPDPTHLLDLSDALVLRKI